MITRKSRWLLRWVMLKETVPSWTDLRSYGSSRILNTSYFWMIVVPLAAKLFSHIPDTIHLPFLEKTLALGIGLPFSWKILFFSSLSFSIANSIYSFFCPRIVKDYRTFAAYNEDRWSRDKIIDYFIRQNLTAYGNSPEGFFAWFDDASKFFNNHSTEPAEFPTLTRDVAGVRTFLSYLKGVKIAKNHDRDAFYDTLENANDLMKPSRILSWLFYLAGFTMVGIILVQNVWFVIVE